MIEHKKRGCGQWESLERWCHELIIKLVGKLDLVPGSV